MSETLNRVFDVITSRKLENGGDPDKSYVARLFSKGDDAILKKIGEEATELVMAAKDARAAGDAGKVVHLVTGEDSDESVVDAGAGTDPVDEPPRPPVNGGSRPSLKRVK